MSTMVPSDSASGGAHQLSGNMPMSYSMSTVGLAGTPYDTTAYLSGGGGPPMATGYHVIGGQYGTITAQQQHLMHQQQQAHQAQMMGQMGSPYSPYSSYGSSAATFSTLQHPRRVRVLPGGSSGGSMQSTPPPQVGSPATSLSMTSSGSTSLATNVHRTSTDQLSRSPMTDV